MTTCTQVIDMQAVKRSERRRGFQPPYYTVWVYQCPACGKETYVRANSFLGKRPVPSRGGFVCGGSIPNFALLAKIEGGK
jgi:hypothetical protein